MLAGPRHDARSRLSQRLIRIGLLLPLLLVFACNALTPAVSATQAPADAAYAGQFDCEGLENGLRAYSGRITLMPGGVATFKDYDGNAQTGAWTYDAQANAYTFSGSLVLASAIYMPANDTLIVVFVPSAKVVHAANGGMECQRAVPGKTGPP